WAMLTSYTISRSLRRRGGGSACRLTNLSFATAGASGSSGRESLTAGGGVGEVNGTVIGKKDRTYSAHVFRRIVWTFRSRGRWRDYRGGCSSCRPLGKLRRNPGNARARGAFSLQGS